MIAELTQSFALLKTASDLVKGFNSMQKEIAVGDIKIELNNIILALQANTSSLNEKYNSLVYRKDELEKEIANLKDFKSQKDKYVLSEITTGVIAYIPKDEKDRVSSNHWFCQNCLDNSQTFCIYQVKGKHSMDIDYHCPACKNQFTTKNPDYINKPPPQSNISW